MAFFLLVYGVFVAWYAWSGFKPAHLGLRSRYGYVHPSTIDPPDFPSPSMARYRRVIEERRGREA